MLNIARQIYLELPRFLHVHTHFGIGGIDEPGIWTERAAWITAPSLTPMYLQYSPLLLNFCMLKIGIVSVILAVICLGGSEKFAF